MLAFGFQPNPLFGDESSASESSEELNVRRCGGWVRPLTVGYETISSYIKN